MFIKNYGLVLLWCSCWLLSCGIPKDPEDSWKEAQEKGLRVGVVKGSLMDNELQLIRDFCQSKSVKAHFVKNTETTLMKKLEKYELDVVIGGFDKKTIWKEKTGMTKPYDSTHIFLIGQGENRLLYELESYLSKVRKP